MRHIILDTETTGLSPAGGHRIIEIGCLEMVDRRLTGKQFHEYINPCRDIDPQAQKVHGLSRDFLKDKPEFSSVRDNFLDFVGDAALVIHNAPFDLEFLDHELTSLDRSHARLSDRHEIVDTLVLARKKHPGQRNNLDTLCRRYGVDNRNRALHGALKDSELLAQVYLLMTGGQGQLFGESVSDAAAEGLTNELVSDHGAISIDLRVIRANETELKAHEAYFTDAVDT